ncbi:hypothetical protein D3C85_1298600 [compost metagenome]
MQGDVEVDQAAAVQWQHHQLESAALCQLLPGQQVGVVLQGANGNFVTGLEQRLKPIGEQVQGRGGAMGEDDLLAVDGVQPAGDLFPAAFEGLGRQGAGQVLGTVHIGSTMAVVVAQGIEQDLRFLRGSGAVQVGLVLALQGVDGWKVSAPGGGLEHDDRT